MVGNAVATRQKPRRMNRTGRADPVDVAKLMDAIEAVPAADRLYVALMYSAGTFSTLARHSLSPAQTVMCDTQIAIIRNLVPKRIWDMMENVREKVGLERISDDHQ